MNNLNKDSGNETMNFFQNIGSQQNTMSASTIVHQKVLEKTPQTWMSVSTTGANDNGPQISLNDLERNGDNQVPYDQFEGKQSTYHENLYNVTYDPNKLTEKQKQEANRVAKEIEAGDSKGNRHLAEERGQVNLRDNDYDENEETSYSAVVRSDQPRH